MSETQLLKRGILLGVVASVVASLLLTGTIIAGEVLHRLHEGRSFNEHVGFSGVAVILVLATTVVSLLPGAVGGAANTCILYRLSSKGELAKVTSIVSGLLLGFLAGFVTVLGIMLMAEAKVDANVVHVAFQVSCFSAPMGGWHGWKVSKWLLETQ